MWRDSEPDLMDLLNRRVPQNDRDPSGQFSKILNMESKTSKHMKSCFGCFLYWMVLYGIGLYWIYLMVLEHSSIAT